MTPLEDKEDARDDGEADRYEIPEEAIGEGEQTDFPPKVWNAPGAFSTSFFHQGASKVAFRRTLPLQ